MTPALVQLYSEPGHYSLHEWQNIMFACWTKGATGPAVARVARFRQEMQDRHPEGVSIVYLIADQAGLPTAEARVGVKEMMARFSEHRACLAIVVKGSGFWASAMRAAITGVRMLVPLQFPMRIFENTEGVVHWLPGHHQKQTGIRLQPAEFRRVLNELTAAM